MARLISFLLLVLAPLATAAQEDVPASEPPMTIERLDQIITTLDPQAQSNVTTWQMQVGDIMVIIVSDPATNRMRAMAPIRDAADLTVEDLTRMMQANFDTTLDARYAIAQGTLWAAFIHPLSPLEKDEFISGLGQVANLALSYGTTYSGGALQYGGGDSDELQRRLIDELLEKGQEI